MIPDMSKPPPGFNTPLPIGNMQLQEDAVVAIPAIPAIPANTSMPVGNTQYSVFAQMENHQNVEPKIQKPTVPYYELPAGLMVPLIRLEDCSYRSLDPEDIRLPAPAPPSERLLQAIEAFYSLPSHDRPRDGYVAFIMLSRVFTSVL